MLPRERSFAERRSRRSSKKSLFSMDEVRLGVNLDHVTTLRQARRTPYPDFTRAIGVAEGAGADGITIHLREDRRHIQDDDVRAARAAVTTTLNLEMAATGEMVEIALAVKPDFCCIVPERREELTTEGGLDVTAHAARVGEICTALTAGGIRASLFIEPDERVIDAAVRAGAPVVELHTGAYANAAAETAPRELERIVRAARYAAQCGLTVNAGHGLHRANVRAVAAIAQMNELNIGHAIIAEAVFMGLAGAVRAMKEAMRGKD